MRLPPSTSPSPAFPSLPSCLPLPPTSLQVGPGLPYSRLLPPAGPRPRRLCPACDSARLRRSHGGRGPQPRGGRRALRPQLGLPGKHTLPLPALRSMLLPGALSAYVGLQKPYPHSLCLCPLFPDVCVPSSLSIAAFFPAVKGSAIVVRALLVASILACPSVPFFTRLSSIFCGFFSSHALSSFALSIAEQKLSFWMNSPCHVLVVGPRNCKTLFLCIIS